MKKLINIWHYVSVYLAGLTAMIALFAPVNPVQKCLLASITILFLHFFEEFGYPGGFPLMGMKVMMNSDEMDYTKWDVNNLSSMFVWYDYVLAVIWFVAVFMFCFRSKFYWNLGKKEGYDLTDVTAYGAYFENGVKHE